MARIIIQEEGGSKTVELTESVITFGRGPDNRVVLQEKSASRRQFQIEKVDQGYKMVDLESRNGTRVNEAFVNQSLLKPGDRIRVGRAVILFEDNAGPSPSAPIPVKAPAAAPAAAPSPGPGPDETSPDPESPRRGTRRHKLAGSRVNRADLARRKEESTIKVVVIIVGLIGVGVLGLIVASSVGGESPEHRRARQDYKKALAMKDDQPEEALKLLDAIPSSISDIHRNAENLAVEIRGELSGSGSGGAQTPEQKEFYKVHDFCELHRQNPTKHAEMVRMCEAFKSKFPNSLFMKHIDEYLALAKRSMNASKTSTVAAAERSARDHLSKNEFGLALGKLNKALEEFKDNLDARERLVRLHEEIVDKARAHFKAEHARASALEKGGKAAEARKAYTDLIIKMGDGTVEELNDFCLIARAARDALN